MREITSHIVNPANDKIRITVLDQQGAGGANHVYGLSGMDFIRNEAAMKTPDDQPEGDVSIIFQCGGIAEHGVNGVTQEALLAIVADRLECFQAGPFASVYNQQALEHVKAAQDALQSRTRERMARGVEGKTVA